MADFKRHLGTRRGSSDDCSCDVEEAMSTKMKQKLSWSCASYEERKVVSKVLACVSRKTVVGTDEILRDMRS